MRYGFGICTVIFWVFCAAASGQNVPVVSPVPALPEIMRGQQVTIHGENFPPQDIKVYLKTGQEKPGDAGIERPAKRVDERTLSFSLPNDIPPGRYLVSVLLGAAMWNVPGDLHVLSDASAPVHLDVIYPATSFPSALHQRYDLEIAGQNLAAKPEDNIIEVIGKGPESMGTETECAAAKISLKYDKPCVEVDQGMETQKLRVVGFQPDKYRGPVQIRVRVGNNVSNALPVTFSRVAAGTVLTITLVVFVVFALIALGLPWKGVGHYKIDGKTYSPLTSFFLEKETNSYSLSRFQLLLWTAVAVFGYVYLFLCRILIQWDFMFPPIPEGLPGLLAISAGTTVASVGITVSRGSKGAGPVQPSMADLISTGGVVAGERLQFFIWTLVGCIGFVSLLILSDPSGLKELPKVPDNFLYLMGLSSAGYLGGKLARKPGPKIKALSVARIAQTATDLPDQNQPPPHITLTDSVLTINLKGENLSESATIRIDDELLRGDLFWITTKKRQDPPSEFCVEVEVSLNAASTYLDGEHTLTLINGDGQGASVRFPIDPLSIDVVARTPANAEEVDVTVKGKNFAEGMTAEWKPPCGTVTLLPTDRVTRKSDTELTVRLVPGQTPGSGGLTLISAIGLRASQGVTITE